MHWTSSGELVLDPAIEQLSEHDPECTGCEHGCPWQQSPMGAPFCSVCDDHYEAGGEDA